jgi:hypothetical protein
MKTASVNDLKYALQNLNGKELIQVCLRMSKHSKESKELLTYLLFEADNEMQYIEHVKADLDDYFSNIQVLNFSNLLKKLRKAVRMANKYIKFSGSKQVEVAVLIYICGKLKPYVLGITSTALNNLYQRQLTKIEKSLSKLDEDLQFDYQQEITNIHIPLHEY